MAVRIDLEKRELVCSVHDLLPETTRSGLGGLGEGLSRLTVGAELHRIIQNQRMGEDPKYVAEVAVDTTLSIDEYTLRILGRADGVTIQSYGNSNVVENRSGMYIQVKTK